LASGYPAPRIQILWRLVSNTKCWRSA